MKYVSFNSIKYKIVIIHFDHFFLAALSLWIILVAYFITWLSLQCIQENFLTISLTLSSSKTFLHSGYAQRLPIENSAILRGDSEFEFSFVTRSTSRYKAPNFTRSGISVLELRTKLPSAPAALALVFSSRSYSKSTSKGTQGLK